MIEQTRTMGFFELVKTGTPQDVQAAIDAGADANAQDKYDGTALMWAAENNQNPEVIITLLTAGADLEAEDEDGMTPLMLAAWYNQNPEVIIVLLKAGADAKAKDYAGKTAFGHASTNAKLKGTDAYKELEEASK